MCHGDPESIAFEGRSAHAILRAMSPAPPADFYGLTDERFRAAFNTIERYIEDRYAVPVIIKDVPNPFTGDLDGAEIHVDYEVEVEEALFIIAHLFGHTVQWNISPTLRAFAAPVQGQPDAALLAQLMDYEGEACRYSLQLFHDAGVIDLDRWLADFAACDKAYLRHFYVTGEKLPFRSFWKTGQPPLEPLPIPRFTPTRWTTRWQGVVL